MKLKSLYEGLDARVLPPGLKAFHDKIAEEAGPGICLTYAAVLLETRSTPSLFWIVPDRKGWVVLAFAKEHYPLNQDHISLWKKLAAETVLNAHRKDYTEEELERFRSLFNAYPRGRLEQARDPLTWWIGFGGDYPPGFTPEKLMSRLGVGPANCTFDENTQHWLADKDARVKADQILGRTK